MGYSCYYKNNVDKIAVPLSVNFGLVFFRCLGSTALNCMMCSRRWLLYTLTCLWPPTGKGSEFQVLNLVKNFEIAKVR